MVVGGTRAAKKKAEELAAARWKKRGVAAALRISLQRERQLLPQAPEVARKAVARAKELQARYQRQGQEIDRNVNAYNALVGKFNTAASTAEKESIARELEKYKGEIEREQTARARTERGFSGAASLVREEKARPVPIEYRLVIPRQVGAKRVASIEAVHNKSGRTIGRAKVTVDRKGNANVKVGRVDNDFDRASVEGNLLNSAKSFLFGGLSKKPQAQIHEVEFENVRSLEGKYGLIDEGAIPNIPGRRWGAEYDVFAIRDTEGRIQKGPTREHLNAAFERATKFTLRNDMRKARVVYTKLRRDLTSIDMGPVGGNMPLGEAWKIARQDIMSNIEEYAKGPLIARQKEPQKVVEIMLKRIDESVKNISTSPTQENLLDLFEALRVFDIQGYEAILKSKSFRQFYHAGFTSHAQTHDSIYHKMIRLPIVKARFDEIRKQMKRAKAAGAFEKGNLEMSREMLNQLELLKGYQEEEFTVEFSGVARLIPPEKPGAKWVIEPFFSSVSRGHGRTEIPLKALVETGVEFPILWHSHPGRVRPGPNFSEHDIEFFKHELGMPGVLILQKEGEVELFTEFE